MTALRVGVLRGGPSNEYEVSLQSGSTVLTHLPLHYKPKDIFINRDGVWHDGGVAYSPEKILKRVDVVWNALHGEYGEDGKVQKIMETFGTPYTGSESFPSALAMHKTCTKDFLKRAMEESGEDIGMRLPIHRIVNKEDVNDEFLRDLFQTMPQPLVVKPISAGSSMGTSIVQGFGNMRAALEKAFAFGGPALVEEFISGIEATCGVVDNFRGQTIYTLPPVEIIPAGKFFDYESKYGGKSKEICPSNFPQKVKDVLGRASAFVHKTLGLRHYSRSDFIVHPVRGVYFLEVNTLPGMTSESLLPKSLAAVGCPLPHFFDHVIGMAVGR